jgi:hypothetical protein
MGVVVLVAVKSIDTLSHWSMPLSVLVNVFEVAPALAPQLL